MPVLNNVVIDPTDQLGPDPEQEMTEQQAIKLRELTSRADEAFDGSLTYRQAQRRIAHLEEYLD